jgi:hypothetical protein
VESSTIAKGSIRASHNTSEFAISIRVGMKYDYEARARFVLLSEILTVINASYIQYNQWLVRCAGCMIATWHSCKHQTGQSSPYSVYRKNHMLCQCTVTPSLRFDVSRRFSNNGSRVSDVSLPFESIARGDNSYPNT